MLRTEFDNKGAHSVRFPRRVIEVLRLARAFILQEESQAVEIRTPFYQDVSVLVEQVERHVDQKQVGETQRVLAAEDLKRLDGQAHDLARQIRDLL